MTNPEHRGSIRPSLYGLARKASIGERWIEQVPQSVAVERKADLPEYEFLSLRVAFEARRIKLGEGALQTFYNLSVTEVQDQMVALELPDTVQKTLADMRLKKPGEPDIMVIGTAESEEVIEQLIEEDEKEDDDARFRFERSVRYRFDGNATPLSVDHEEIYFLTEEGDETLSVTSSQRYIDLQREEAPVLTLSAWAGAESAPFCTIDGVCEVPDATSFTSAALATDVQFLELVQTYSTSPELAQHSKREAVQAALSIVAFLQFEDSDARKVRALL